MRLLNRSTKGSSGCWTKIRSTQRWGLLNRSTEGSRGCGLKSDQHKDGVVKQINSRIERLLNWNQSNTKMGLVERSTEGYGEVEWKTDKQKVKKGLTWKQIQKKDQGSAELKTDHWNGSVVAELKWYQWEIKACWQTNWRIRWSFARKQSNRRKGH